MVRSVFFSADAFFMYFVTPNTIPASGVLKTLNDDEDMSVVTLDTERFKRVREGANKSLM